jgi:peptide-methionine (R)-S-oxide reductase
MMKRGLLLASGSVLTLLLGRRAFQGAGDRAAAGTERFLSPAQYAVLRQQATERPGSSPLDQETRRGRYDCAGCGHPLFSSNTKFHSGTGWPSFWQPLDDAVDATADRSLLMMRTEVHCHLCGGHLGHVFDDGPRPTGLRYCMNGVALAFHSDT